MTIEQNRRGFLKNIAATSAVTGSLAVPSIASAKKKHRWRLAMAIPKTLPLWGPMVEEFAKKVQLLSGGRLKIKVYGAGELVPALGVFDAVKAGQVQMGHAVSYYWAGKMPAAAFFTGVPFGMTLTGQNAWLKSEGLDLWRELYKKQGVVPFAAGNTGTQMGGWFNKPINSVADFKGLKMRIPGLGGKVVSKVGGKPVLVAGGEIYTNLSTGVIDATEWVGPYHDYVMGFHKAAKYCYFPGWHEPNATLELSINQKAWDSLDKDLQQLVATCANELDREMHLAWVAKDMEYYEKIKNESKAEFKAYPDDVMKALYKAAEEVKSEVAKTSAMARRIYESYTRFQKRHEEFQVVKESGYHSVLSKVGKGS